jgi:hypothetical protein
MLFSLVHVAVTHPTPLTLDFGHRSARVICDLATLFVGPTDTDVCTQRTPCRSAMAPRLRDATARCGCCTSHRTRRPVGRNGACSKALRLKLTSHHARVCAMRADRVHRFGRGMPPSNRYLLRRNRSDNPPARTNYSPRVGSRLREATNLSVRTRT